MANEKRLIDANKLIEHLESCIATTNKNDRAVCLCIKCFVEQMPTVDAVELPKGKPGDFLEWDNGTGFRQIYRIQAVMICPDCMRYDLEKFAPVVNHPCILRILSYEEAEKEWHERCEREKTHEEPNFTAFGAKMDGDGNG